MKKILFFCLMLAGGSLESVAQYFINDPVAFGKGRALYTQGVNHLINNEYGKAINAFVEGLDLFPDNYEGYGVCCELGFGDEVDRDLALDCYKDGAKKGSLRCKAQLERIKQHGFWPATKENRRQLIQNLKTQYGMGSSSSSLGGDGMNMLPSRSSSSGSSGQICRGCGGSGRCTGCSGQGSYWVDSGIYTGSGSRTKVSCGSCGGSGTCRVCYGKGVIR